MTHERDPMGNPRMHAAIAELQELIRGRYPEATFRVSQGEDPEGVYLRAMVDVEDRGEVVDVFLDRLVDLQVDEGLPLYVLPVRPPARNAAILQERSRSSRIPEALPLA